VSSWRDEIRSWCLQQPGHLWYKYDSQDLDAGLGDCSGVIVEALKLVGRIGAGEDYSAQMLSQKYPMETLDPQPGDVHFYGKNWQSVQHCMFHFGELRDDGDLYPAAVCGMLHGDKATKGDSTGRLFGRGFFFVRDCNYWRSMYLGCRKVD
jgi:hypothetical protein